MRGLGQRNSRAMAQRNILITGCSSGIGLASARLMKKRGWRVIATARQREDIQRLREAEGLDVLGLELADGSSIAACAYDALAMCDGRLDALFNNAAFGQPGAVEDLSVDVLRAQFEVNVFGTHELTRRIIPSMREAGTGRIVQCSSVLGLVAAPYRGAYCASKFALEALTDAMRLELEGTGISISLIEPGPIDTQFVANAVAAARRSVDIEGSVHREKYQLMLDALGKGGRKLFKLKPEAVAAKLVHAVESPKPKARYFVTVPTYLAGAAKRGLPTRALDWFAARN